MTKIQIMPAWKDVKPAGHYVYIHIRESDGVIFYVGRGQKSRGWSKQGRSDYWHRVSRKHGCRIEICQDNLSLSNSKLLEMWMISKLRHDGANLCNVTDGGEGITGYKHSREVRNRISMSQSKTIYTSLKEEFLSLADAVKYLRDNGYPKASAGNISMCANGNQVVAYGRLWSYYNFPEHELLLTQKERAAHGMKKVLSVPVYSDVYGYFPSMTIAADFLKEIGYTNARHGNISTVCKGLRKSAYGSGWSYYDKRS